jgi:hypothetical protein
MRSKIPAVAAGLVLVASTAMADDYVHEGPDLYAWREPGLVTGFGLGVEAGAGVTGFTGQTMRDTVPGAIGGLWNLRVMLGTHVPLALELGYLGEASNINVFGAPNGTLIGTTAEADLRWNILPHLVFDPYIFAGVGYQRYDVQNAQLSEADSGMRSSDNSVEIPMGLGASWRDPSGFTVDLRGTYRQSIDASLIANSNGSFASLSWWEASAALGYEF